MFSDNQVCTVTCFGHAAYRSGMVFLRNTWQYGFGLEPRPRKCWYHDIKS